MPDSFCELDTGRGGEKDIFKVSFRLIALPPMLTQCGRRSLNILHIFFDPCPKKCDARRRRRVVSQALVMLVAVSALVLLFLTGLMARAGMRPVAMIAARQYRA